MSLERVTKEKNDFSYISKLLFHSKIAMLAVIRCLISDKTLKKKMLMSVKLL